MVAIIGFTDYPLYSPHAVEPDVFTLNQNKTVRFERKRFVEPGVSYYAWTLDGVTPIFPIPVDES